MSIQHELVSRNAWLTARLELLAEEKKLTARQDEVAAMRRALPWVRVERAYEFDDADGTVALAGLFEGRSQLLIYHFMFAPDWEVGCKSCSFWADHFDSLKHHLHERDVSLAVVSRAALPKLQAFAQRLGWSFRWVSSAKNDFNHDFGVSYSNEEVETGEQIHHFGTQKPHGVEAPGISVFFKDEDQQVYHTYSCYARGLEPLNATYHALDLVPKGRDEAELPFSMAWVRLHDEYDV